MNNPHLVALVSEAITTEQEKERHQASASHCTERTSPALIVVPEVFWALQGIGGRVSLLHAL